jgi:hypothetical protein
MEGLKVSGALIIVDGPKISSEMGVGDKLNMFGELRVERESLAVPEETNWGWV